MGALFRGNYRVSSGYGPRYHPIQKTWKQHTGVDYATPAGTVLLAPFSGKVVENRYQARKTANGKIVGWGNTVVIQAANGVRYRASHLQNLSHLKVGETVRQGQTIGRSGSSGGSSGPHLDAMLYNAQGQHLNIQQWLGKPLAAIANAKTR